MAKAWPWLAMDPIFFALYYFSYVTPLYYFSYVTAPIFLHYSSDGTPPHISDTSRTFFAKSAIPPKSQQSWSPEPSRLWRPLMPAAQWSVQPLPSLFCLSHAALRPVPFTGLRDQCKPSGTLTKHLYGESSFSIENPCKIHRCLSVAGSELKFKPQ